MSITEDNGRFSILVNNGAAGTISERAVSISYKVPKQVLRLKGYRVRMDTANDALASGILGIDITTSSGSSIISSNHMITNIQNRPIYPLALDNAIITNRDGLEKILFMSRDAEEDLKITVYKITGSTNTVALEDKILSLYLDFETEIGGLI